MKINLVGAFRTNFPFGTEIAFLKGLERIGGHDIWTLDPNIEGQGWRHDADATIVFKTAKSYNGELLRTSGKKIVYQPDDHRFPHIAGMMREMRAFCDHALTFDASGAEFARSVGYASAECLVVTADDTLYRRLPDVEKDMDLTFVGSLSNSPAHASRLRMIEVLGKAGFKVGYMHDVYDVEAIVEVYNRSKIVLNHATDVGQPFGHGHGYQCRIFEAGMTGACVLTNTVIDEREIDPLQQVVAVANYSGEESLIDTARILLADDFLRKSYGDNLFSEIRRRHLPEHRAQDLLDFIG